MAVTIKDVAKVAGVSITTVSMILNNTDNKFSKQTREKVIDAANKIGYVPNSLAKKLMIQRSRTIVMIVPDIENLFFINLAKASSEYAVKRGYTVVLVDGSIYLYNLTKLQSDIKKQKVEGLLVVSRCLDSFTDEEIESFDIKKVFFDETIENSRIHGTMVAGDNIDGGKLVAEYIIKNGYTQIGIITGPKNSLNNSKRLNGFIDVLSYENIKLDEIYIEFGDYTYESGYLAVDRLMKRKIQVIFCLNDLMAHGAMKRLRELEVKVPEEISIIGYDDLDMNKYIYPRLTSVNQQANLIGKTATKKLIDMLEGKESNKREVVLIKPLFVEGETCKKVGLYEK